MTAKIKLNAASGGGSFSLQAPSSSSKDRVMTFADTADGTILTTTNPKSGNSLQVVSTTKTDVFSTTTTGSYVDLTGLSVSITTTGSNKVKLEGTIFWGASNDTFWHGRLVRTTGGTATPIFIGDASGSMIQSTFSGFHMSSSVGQYLIKNQSFTFLDTPSAGTHTYKIQVYLVSGSEIIINRNSNGTDAARTGKGVSSILASEVAA